MDWHELQKKKVDELRTMATEKAGVTGASGLHKDELVEIVAKALGIDKPHLVVEGLDKSSLKRHIREANCAGRCQWQLAERKPVGTAKFRHSLQFRSFGLTTYILGTLALIGVVRLLR